MTLANPQEAYDLLEKLNISFEKLEHVPITSVENLDFKLPGQQVKNLFLKDKKSRRFYLVLLHDEKQANLSLLAESLGEKKLSFARDEQVRDLLRVQPGTITPLSLIFDSDHKIQMVVDSQVDQTLTIGVHPFINDTTLNIKFIDFKRFLEYTGHELRVVDS